MHLNFTSICARKQLNSAGLEPGLITMKIWTTSRFLGLSNPATALLLGLLLFSHLTFATTITETFLTLTQRASSTAVWNYEIGFLHPALQVTNYQAPSQPAANQAMDVGDGSDGVFNNSTYPSFGTVSGTTIIINAITHPSIKVSSFHLDSGITLTAINGPLVIYSLGDVYIDGIIECSGRNGNPAVAAFGGSGGLGRCGGANGGNGGNALASGSGGLPLAGSVSGGGGGTYLGAAPGAGGGGAGAYAGNPGANGFNSVPATNTGGTAGNGAAGANFEFTILNGSPGGGGGSGSNAEGGSGGGGGGGTVVIHAVGNVNISATGSIFAKGGNGGAANFGGGGGGGGGGGVKILTPGNLYLATGIPIDVTGGNGAVPAVANAGAGGTGSFGRTWDNSKTFSGLGSESHGSGLILLGQIEYVRAPLTGVSKSFDTGNANPTFVSSSTNPTNADISMDMAASSDNFSIDDSGWVSATTLASLSGRRYVKFRVNLTNSNATTPTRVDDVSINYTLPLPSPPSGPAPSPTAPAFKDNFEFRSGCARVAHSQGSASEDLVFITLLLMLLPFLLGLQLRRNVL